MNPSAARKPLVELRNVSKSFRLESGTDLRVLHSVSLTVDEDEIVAILGPSGSGKSTCLRIMGGLVPPGEGEVFCNQKPLEGVNPGVAMVFQSFALFPWETVYTNIALPLRPLGLTLSEIKARVKKVIDLVGLEGYEEAYPRELSGGMKQRVGVARALVMERPVLFLDEPFSSLDILTADTLRTEMVKIFLDKKTATRSMVLVTHNIEETVSMARRILVMGTNPGHIRREIINDLPYPRDESSAGFRRMVQQVYASITEALMPDVPAPTETSTALARALPKEPPIETLPNVQIVEMIGLLEAVGDHGGKADIFELAHETGKEFGRTLYLVKAAELLDLVETPKQTVLLTDLGRHFVEGDINIRKRMLHELFGSLRIVQMASNLLRKSETLRIPIEELKERVGEWLPAENPEQIIEALVSWGRFAEYFGYNDDAKELYLDVGQETT
ncbi:MAG: nitrate/sulfonate/bicarbonate ABC transporter ATP-binding protein [Oligoflexia bacterium]|nr:nitrate/sulfonate/bicarbonate ABC transporter ATP-binding protein [Oligoflexia bacterium]